MNGRLILMAPFEVGAWVRISLDPAQTERILEREGVVRWQSGTPTDFGPGIEFEALSEDAHAQLGGLWLSGRS